MSDWKVKDPSLAGRGREAIAMAEKEMRGLMTLRARHEKQRPLAGARISGSLHMTVETAVLVETLRALGADVRWSSCNVLSTHDAAAAALAAAGVPVFAWKGETEEEYWWCLERAFTFPDGGGPDLVVDDGGDATSWLHEKAPAATLARVRGISEETTAGIHRLNLLAARGGLKVPVMDVNASVTKSKFDNIYGSRESLVDAIKRTTHLMLAGKRAVVCGYGDVGKGCAEALAAHRARVVVTEIDPICALQALMAGHEVQRLEDAIDGADLVVTATGNRDVVTLEHLARMKDGAVVCNIGHFDYEIQVAQLNAAPGVRRTSIEPGVDRYTFPDGRSVRVLAEGRLVNLACADGHPAFVMSCSFSNQVLAQIDLFQNRRQPGIYRLPKLLDEEVARLHVEALGGRVTRLTPSQAEYLAVPQAGPFKADAYRY